MGINIAMLCQITPDNARYYNFLITETTPPPASSAVKAALGPKDALKDLLRRGCTLATQPWVDNHWSLILWKLAGMVALDPIRETKPGETRWCWPEVIRQLLYRYERELNGGSRPPLRKIANQDAPAAFPMVLCVSNIIWTSGGVTEDGVQIESYPELELTDGWYRLRAQVDVPLARAVKRGIIRIGRKIGFAGARLSTEKKDPTEILEAYNSTHLVLSGNSSHLMPWHTKLGFTEGPCISTLHSLTCDGGVVVALDFVIIKLYPIAFLEFIEDENGNKDRIGPRNEAEEMGVNEQWQNRYEMETSKLRAEYDKKFSRYAGYADRLEKKAGVMLQHAKESDGYAPEQIDSMYDELEYPDTAAKVIARTTSYEAAWLALHIQRQNEKEREQIGEEIEKELRTICPPRNVKSFRILIIQDARTSRRPANRTAQLTVWDVLSLSSDEDSSRAGGFEVGQRFMATNILPQQQSAWMDCAPGSEVYLSTRRDTRWTRIKTTA
ncbi:hypothetical protein HYPSUDRAFT_696943 [Hypholoma sublateritium FD-334 SS-4]|uniref:BRCA2 OB1 domain-containing protein n=1 Tax=Hypholoma sublateritium (strain FD-334 SS-4) TaxID=945553 RepID=A0A0D2PIR6_HYPSF|nr:hypothetical protein HYPSUDRAFT_696943 [Hypholoma sublateritium FD-334 SS-4]